ncbi:response regulator, partial [Leptolyngbya cf. ectocarpi LEGE 11479]
MVSQLNNRHSHHGKPKILIVDDEPDNLALLYRTFYREFQVLQAESGQAALAHLVQHSDTAVIISDQRMPRMNGTELLRQVAQDYPNIIRIILTGYTDVENLVDAINTGQVFKYITKPWEAKELKGVIQQAIDTHAILKSRTQELDRILAQETLLNTITQAIHSSLEPKQIFSAITQKLGQALETDGCAISLWTPEDDYVDCVGLYDASQDRPLPKSPVKISENPILQELVASRSPVIFDDLTQSHTHTPLHLPFHSQATALLVVPLITDGQIIGSISLRQSKQPKHWHMEEINLAQAVANQAAIAVQQARLYQTTRQQAEQLLALDKQKTTFFQNISHEFRTPLTLTIGPLESAVEQGKGLSFEQSVIALRSSQRLLRLVNQLLDLQRLDAGSMQATFYPCDFAQVVSSVTTAFQAYCDRKHITLSTQIQPCPPVYLDLEKFDKVVYNILSNAVKFTPTGGTIQITLNTFEQRCYLEIEDTGIGIRKEQLPHIFERFQQADGSASRTHEGTGLGLALVKELVELHGGEVRVSSTYGTGTLFTVELPLGADHLPAERIHQTSRRLEQSRAAVELADLHHQVAPVPSLLSSRDQKEQIGVPTSTAIDAPMCPLPHPSNRHDGATILVVDDNPDLRRYVASILQRRGHRISTAQNGATGLEVARNIQPQLIITDLMMPQVSGIELIQQIRLDPHLQGTPIILL